ncbi:MAG: Gfo/Idh/MocA family oxidoreductase [Bauldia sp.]
MTRLLMLGTGHIARAHALAYKAEPDIEMVAAVESNLDRLGAIADEHGIRHRFRTLDQALDWGAFDAAVNMTPDDVHYPTTMRLIAAGKYVFCEKPLAGNYRDAVAMRDAAEAAAIVNMVNLTYRRDPALQQARRMVLAGAIGEMKHFEATYYQSWLVGNHWGDWRTGERWLWRLSAKHGSRGVVGDVGIHIVDFAIFGAASDITSVSSRVKTFKKAENDRIGEYVLDANDTCLMSVDLANGALGVIQATRWATGHKNTMGLSMFGTRGALRVLYDGETSSLMCCAGEDVNTQTWHPVDCPPTPTTYQRFAEALRTGVNGEPDFRHAAKIQQILDLCIERSDQATTFIAPGR